MKATPVLIKGLREAAARILSPEGGYQWYASESCNCGILAQALGAEKETLRIAAPYIWSKSNYALGNGKCSMTGAYLHDVYKILAEAGIEPHDLEEIEFLGLFNAGLWDKGIWNSLQEWQKPQTVAAWFLARADLLESQLVSQSVPVKPVERQTVSV